MAFGRSIESKQLEQLCNELGGMAARVISGRVTTSDFTDFAGVKRHEVARLYDEIARTEGQKAARRATKEGIVHIDIYLRNNYQAINAANSLYRTALKSMVNGPVW